MKRFLQNCFLIIFFAGLTSQGFPSTDPDFDIKSSPPEIGNYALPTSQQPGPMISFGQTLIGRNVLQLEFDTFNPYHLGISPFSNENLLLTFGITDSTSLYINYPLAATSQSRVFRHTILKDLEVQLEQAFYAYGNRRYQEQATIVGAFTTPMGDVKGIDRYKYYGASTFFLGGTYNRTYVDWLLFVSPGVQITGASHGNRLGSQYLYQAGIGYALLSVKDESIVSLLLEMDGQYSEKDIVFSRTLQNTGGNVVALTPSLSLAEPWFIARIGVGFPVVQDLNGYQTKMSYFIASSISITIT